MSDAYTAYCVDMAVALAGDAMERSETKAEPEPEPPALRMQTINGLPLLVGTIVKQ